MNQLLTTKANLGLFGRRRWTKLSGDTIKYMKWSLHSKYLTRTYKKTSHTTWTLNLLYKAYNCYFYVKVHVVWLVFLQVRVTYIGWRDFSRSFGAAMHWTKWIMDGGVRFFHVCINIRPFIININISMNNY